MVVRSSTLIRLLPYYGLVQPNVYGSTPRWRAKHTRDVELIATLCLDVSLGGALAVNIAEILMAVDIIPRAAVSLARRNESSATQGEPHSAVVRNPENGSGNWIAPVPECAQTEAVR
jgi:hypothetical protein